MNNPQGFDEAKEKAEFLAEAWADANYPSTSDAAKWIATRNGYRKGYVEGFKAANELMKPYIEKAYGEAPQPKQQAPKDSKPLRGGFAEEP